MLVTLTDGHTPYLFDTETSSIDKVRSPLKVHTLRMHVYDPVSNETPYKFTTRNIDMQNEIIRAVAKVQGGLMNSRNPWVKNVLKRKEISHDTSREREIVTEDLASIFGSQNVYVSATSLRYIYYISDGTMESTPDKIGKKFGHPLIYEGYVIATVFDIKGMGVLEPDHNVVHWLTMPMWNGFHTKKRKAPREFPWPTGFVCTYWCQREGYHSYKSGMGIRLASMTQGQTVGTWALMSLRQYWMSRQGSRDIFSWLGKTYTDTGSDSGNSGYKKLAKYALASSNAPLGIYGVVCIYCGSTLTSPYGKCGSCYGQHTPAMQGASSVCTQCGLPIKMPPWYNKSYKLCSCENKSEAFADSGLHSEQASFLSNIPA